MTLFYHFQPVRWYWLKMIKQNHRKFPENFILVQILKLQDVTFRSLFHTLSFKIVQCLWFLAVNI